MLKSKNAIVIAIMLAALYSLYIITTANEKPISNLSLISVSPEAENQNPDPNWELKDQATQAGQEHGSEESHVDSYVPLIGENASNFDPPDDCTNPRIINIPGDMPYADIGQTTCGRGNRYEETCLGNYDGGEDIIYELNVTETTVITISFDPKGTAWTGLLVDDVCPSDDNCIAALTSSNGSPYEIYGLELEPGTYYMMVDTWPSPDCIPEFNLSITAPAEPGEGDDCLTPKVIIIPDDIVVDEYSVTDSTCGRHDFYDNTCLGYYDGGEEIIFELEVNLAFTIDIDFDPMGTPWTGLAVGQSCPPEENCLVNANNGSSGAPIYIQGLHLEPGYYYLMIDTWPAPYCIPQFTLGIYPGEIQHDNDSWEFAEYIENVVDLEFSTVQATFDGPGECMTSPNIWYCYSAYCDGRAIASLCGSGYDTKIAVYEGCGAPTASNMIACNDDFCGLQSEVMWYAEMDKQYLIEVGGYSSHTGSGFLSVNCEIDTCTPPPNDNCEDVTPIEISSGETHAFEGNNYCSHNQCTLLDDYGHAWEAFTLPGMADVTIDYCGTSPAFEVVYQVIFNGCPCEEGEIVYPDNASWNDCGDGNFKMEFDWLPPGTYYIPVLSEHADFPDDYYEGPYTINVTVGWVTDCPGWGGCDEYISRVTLAEIDNISTCENHGDFTDLTANLVIGENYPITIEIADAYSMDRGAVWVDWNQDYDFNDPDEMIPLDVDQGYGPYTGTVTPPEHALPGSTVMRIRLCYYNEPDPCSIQEYGEVEDYTVNVMPGGEHPDILIYPDPIYAVMQYSYDDTLKASIYLGGEFAGGGHNVEDINQSTVLVNSSLVPVTIEVLPEYNDFVGAVLKITVSMSEFIGSYPLLWDYSLEMYNVSGEFIGGAPFIQDGTVQMVGHTSGDANFDGVVNILDITCLINHIYKAGQPPEPVPETGDANGDGALNILDVTRLIAFLYKNGPPPTHP